MRFGCAWLMSIVLVAVPAQALDSIPQSSGFSGFGIAAPAYFNVQSSIFVGGPPLLDDVGDERIDSIFEEPAVNGSPAALIGGEINYTFAGTRTQVYLGARLEDILRLDVATGLGVRQELSDGSILAASVLGTPLQREVWSDPYVEGEDRQRTDFTFPGARLRWGGMFRTGLELTATYRRIDLGEETSGDWLIDQGRLDPGDQSSLDREGYLLNLQALYEVDVEQRHRFQPAIRLVDEHHDGAAVAVRGYDVQLTYLYLVPKFLLDFNALYGQRKADEIHPIYDKTLDGEEIGLGFTAYVPIKRFANSTLSVFGGGEFLSEQANVDFYTSGTAAVQIGLLWRHKRP